MLMGLGVLDWRPTQCCHRDRGRQVARSPGGSPAADPKVAIAACFHQSRAHCQHRLSLHAPIGTKGANQSSRGPFTVELSGAIRLRSSVVELRLRARAGATVADAFNVAESLSIELTTHPSDTAVLHPSPTTSVPQHSGLDTTSKIES